MNGSKEPVYNVVIFLVFIQGAAPATGEETMATLEEHSGGLRQTFATVPPGQWECEVDGDWGGMHRFPGVEVAFTDRSGVHWVRRSSGSVEEISRDAVTYYGLFRPVSFGELRPFMTR